MFFVSWMRRPVATARTAGRRADWAAQREARSNANGSREASAPGRSCVLRPSGAIGGAQRARGQIVNSMMRPHFVPAALGIALAFSACTRPVLYYPDPVPVAVPDTSRATKSAATSRAGRNTTPLEFPDATVAVLGGSATASDAAYLISRRLLVPVSGADMSKVEDSFFEPRDGGRTHRAIDILAPRGTPILSADDGKIIRMTTSELGGISMYTIDPTARLVYYYAHMERYNDAMSPGREIAKGDTLGFVGTTGNAPKDTPHLHFQVMRWPADNRYWDGEAIDPFEALGGVPRQRAHHTGGGADW